ncbi:MAG: hypothetical protein ACD_76C00094G0046 [uncultured bacterium]|nr:MAG: hypothetical protein ACD_76C00094G0046 [uncultured bacterium]HBD04904.1 hypothetical protein [Candidatus Uhrbacteria bacterium]
MAKPRTGEAAKIPQDIYMANARKESRVPPEVRRRTGEEGDWHGERASQIDARLDAGGNVLEIASTKRRAQIEARNPDVSSDSVGFEVGPQTEESGVIKKGDLLKMAIRFQDGTNETEVPIQRFVRAGEVKFVATKKDGPDDSISGSVREYQSHIVDVKCLKEVTTGSWLKKKTELVAPADEELGKEIIVPLVSEAVRARHHDHTDVEIGRKEKGAMMATKKTIDKKYDKMSIEDISSKFLQQESKTASAARREEIYVNETMRSELQEFAELENLDLFSLTGGIDGYDNQFIERLRKLEAGLVVPFDENGRGLFTGREYTKEEQEKILNGKSFGLSIKHARVREALGKESLLTKLALGDDSKISWTRASGKAAYGAVLFLLKIATMAFLAGFKAYERFVEQPLYKAAKQLPEAFGFHIGDEKKK